MSISDKFDFKGFMTVLRVLTKFWDFGTIFLNSTSKNESRSQFLLNSDKFDFRGFYDDFKGFN